ncbi:MAG: recombinase family protein [Candidatus Micrarchaeaceae archaeon]
MIFDDKEILGGVGSAADGMDKAQDSPQQPLKPLKTHYNVYLYARVSTKDKDQNPENQLFVLRAWALRHSFTFLEFVDFESGRSVEKRDEYRKMLKSIDQTDGIAVVAVDRLSRSSLMEGIVDAMKLRNSGKFLYIAETDKFLKPENSEYDWLYELGYKAVNAALESAGISNRVKRAYLYRKAQAEQNKERLHWGRPPLTYKVVKTGADGQPLRQLNGDLVYEYVPVPTDKIKKLWAEGFNMSRIAKEIGCSRTVVRKVLSGSNATA